MNKIFSLVSIIPIILMKSTVSQAESVLHININDDNQTNTSFNGYKMKITGDDNITTFGDSRRVTDKAIVGALNDESLNLSKSTVMNLSDNNAVNLSNENNEVKKSSGMSSSFILIPILAMFCIYAIASIGLLIKKKYTTKSTRPKRRSLHFEDDDELSKILVQSPAATAINSDSFTVRSITKDSHIYQNSRSKLSKKDVSFLPINHAYKATLPWTPKHLDEVKLSVGDIVCIKKCFSDGYSYGRNVTTRIDGVFPTCCLSSMDESIDQAAIEEWVNSGMIKTKKRTTSLFLNDISYKI